MISAKICHVQNDQMRSSEGKILRRGTIRAKRLKYCPDTKNTIAAWKRRPVRRTGEYRHKTCYCTQYKRKLTLSFFVVKWLWKDTGRRKKAVISLLTSNTDIKHGGWSGLGVGSCRQGNGQSRTQAKIWENTLAINFLSESDYR